MRRLSTTRRLLVMSALLWTVVPANAEMVVVMSARSPISALSRNDVVNIFMGRYRRFPDGSPAIPVDAPAHSEDRRFFYRRLVDRSPEEISAYWARLIFSGRTRPPVHAASIPAMQSEVADHLHMLGYMERQHVTQDLKIVYALPD